MAKVMRPTLPNSWLAANIGRMHTLSLASLSLTELQTHMKSWALPAFRAKQIIDWRNKGILSLAAMKNVPNNVKVILEEKMNIESLQLVTRQKSSDGTRKYLFALKRENQALKHIESVLIPDVGRGTVCISSQAGCVLDCPFCHTGTQKFEGNLTAAEILAQVLAVKHDLLTDPMQQDLHNQVTHIVYMGMGEPLANEDAVFQSLELLMAEDYLHLSRRRITVSTSGLVPQIERLGEKYPVNLAISLHTADNTLRDRLVPINQKHDLSKLRQCLNTYPLTKKRHITLEYVMLEGVNDRDEDLQALLKFVHPDRERVNLIRFNTYPGSEFAGSSTERVNQFAKGLISQGIRATVRRSRGDDIMAACGQLKTAKQ
ncbi:MAG: 23S rRNA (adenine(2503)-C(2))-methyltransferase RlmN [Mariprofundaceae bacterium]|nr:23S rRNA (adenine(2503)-C(2))-methyltransferase RlmN [Mariprofundaceae bacterium]